MFFVNSYIITTIITSFLSPLHTKPKIKGYFVCKDTTSPMGTDYRVDKSCFFMFL